MNQEGWIFMISIWVLLVGFISWSYKVLLTEPHIPMGYYEEDHHPGERESIEAVQESSRTEDVQIAMNAVEPVSEGDELTGI
jgi:hypothetical protein